MNGPNRCSTTSAIKGSFVFNDSDILRLVSSEIGRKISLSRLASEIFFLCSSDKVLPLFESDSLRLYRGFIKTME